MGNKQSVNKKILISKKFANVDVADIKIVENVDEIKIVKSVSVEFLDKQRRKLKYIIDEIINTEINYVEFVKYTIKNYLIYSIKDKNRPSDLSDGRLKMVFGNIKELENIHVNLILPQLKIAQYDYNLISKTFLDHESKLFKYLKYCRNKPFSEYIVNSNESYFEKIRYNIADNDGISSLLMKPIQRITRYQLLLKDIRDTVLKIGESAEIADKAYKLMIIIPNQANYMMDLSRLDGLNVDISIHGKVVITEKLKVLFDNDSKYQNVQVKQCFLLEHRFLIANIVEIHCSNIQDRYSFVCEYSTYDILCFNNENDLIMAENEQYSLILTPRKDESDAIVTLFFVDEEGKNKWKDHFDKITQKFTLFMKALQQPTTTGKQTSGSNKSYSSRESEKGDECSKDNESDTLPSISSEDYETEKYIINNDARLLLNYTNESLTKNDFTWKMSNLIDGVYKDLIIDERIYYKLYNNKCVLNVNNCEISDEGFYLCTYGNEKCYFEMKIMENPFFQTMYEGISIKYLDFEDYYTESENSEPKFYTSVLSKYTDEDAENYISYKLLNDENCRALAVDELRILSSLRNKNILNILVNHMYITTEHIYIPFNPCIKTAVIQDIMNLNYLKEDIMSCIIYQLYEAFIYLHSNKILYNNDLLFNVFVHEYEFLSKDITISIANFTKSKYISTETPKFDRIVNGNFKNLATQDFERISNFAFNIYNGTNENDSSGHNYISDIDCNFSFVCYYDYIKSNIKNEYDYLCHYYFTQKSQKHIDTQHIKDYVKNIDL